MKDKVKFYYDEGYNEVIAFFSEIKTSSNRGLQFYQCYSHIGQHSDCCLGYIKELIPATKEQYKPLQKELEGIGYKLKVTNKH